MPLINAYQRMFLIKVHDAYCTEYQLLMYATYVIDLRVVLRIVLSIDNASYDWYRVLYHNTLTYVTLRVTLCYGLLLLWIYSISYRSMMCVITCHQLMHATHVTIYVAISMNVLFLCYGFYVLVYFGLLGYVTYIIDQIFDK